jgi:hypothetical protein
VTYIRIRWRQAGAHIHCRVFTSQDANGTYAKNGDLVFDEREWPDMIDKFYRCELIEELRDANAKG